MPGSLRDLFLALYDACCLCALPYNRSPPAQGPATDQMLTHSIAFLYDTVVITAFNLQLEMIEEPGEVGSKPAFTGSRDFCESHFLVTIMIPATVLDPAEKDA